LHQSQIAFDQLAECLALGKGCIGIGGLWNVGHACPHSDWGLLDESSSGLRRLLMDW
jgi:hypothetical protein